MAGLCRLKKSILGFQAVEFLMLFSTLCSPISNDFVFKSKAWNLLIYLKFCQATLSYNLRCKDEFDQILLESASSSPPKMTYLAIFVHYNTKILRVDPEVK